MLSLRKLTRASADQLHDQLKGILSAVSPLLHPKAALGDYVRGIKDPVRGADALFREINSGYERVSSEKPFGLRRELTAPIDLKGSSVELSPSQYHYSASSNGVTKQVLVVSPFRWVVSYTGYGPEQLRTLLRSSSPSSEDLHAIILHSVALQSIAMRQPALRGVFQALRYSLDVETLPEFGKLPLTYISAPISTLRPPDDVIIETTELTGSDTFEEVIDLQALIELRDPLRDSLIQLARSHGEQI